MQVWWGDRQSLIYNDASIRLLNGKHPRVLAHSGRDAWSDEVWRVIGPAIEKAMATGETQWCESVPMLLERRVPQEEAYMTFSFAPIVGASGTTEGVFGSCVEVTENVIGNRRLSLLHKLGVAVATAHHVDRAAQTLACALRDSVDVPAAVLYIVADKREARAHTWIGTSAETSGLPVATTDGPLSRVIENEEAVELTMQDRHALALPIRGSEGLAGILVCGLSSHLPLDEGYRSFLDLIAAHMTAAITEGGASTREEVPPPLVSPYKRSRDAFLSIVAHELRNPLSALMTTLQALMLRSPSEDIELMERSVRQLSRIVDNLLDVSRIARGRLELRPKQTELANIIDRAMELVTPLFTERNTQVFVRVPRVGLRLDVDPERMAQAITNVLSNASRFSEPGSRVWVQASREYDRVRLMIKDEGSGIEPDRLPIVFEAFYQAPETRPRSAGIGVGLAIARNLVEMHGGKLQITSAGAGHGTECVIEVPTAARATTAASATSRPASPRKVLLVEDNDDSARALKNALEQLGYIVALAHNGPIALNVARTFDPDVVLMDIGLPVMDGWELAKRLRDLRGASHNAPVVAVTAYDRDIDRQRSAEAGFAEHLVKPIDLAKLQEVVESLPLRTTPA
jgi:signal transduction histidine kinase/ActR/RegA family two-component response regulator